MEIIKSDSFFSEEGMPLEIGWFHGTIDDLNSFANSYMVSSISLIDLALNKKDLRDLHLSPIIFLIRHYLELKVKELIVELNYSNNMGRKHPSHHNLKDLWDFFLSIYNKSNINDNNDSLNNLTRLIREICEFDPMSYTFRYPESKDGSRYKRPKYVNLLNMKNTLLKVSHALEIFHSKIIPLSNRKREQSMANDRWLFTGK